MKKALALILSILMVISLFSLAGCDEPPIDGVTNPTTKPTEPVEVTRTVASYEVDEFSDGIGERIEREITYKGVIKIGNTTPSTSGGDAYNNGLKAYINMVNFDGGIGGDYNSGKQGYFIELINYDDGFDPAQGSYYTKKLVETDKIFAIVGQFSEQTVYATIDYIKEMGTIFVGPASGDNRMFNTEAYTKQEGSAIFPVRPIGSVEGYYTTKMINTLYPDAKKIGVISVKYGEGATFKDAIQNQWGFIGECVVVEATEDFDFDMSKLSDCDVIAVAAGRDGTESIIENLRAKNNRKPVFASGIIANEFETEALWYENIGNEYKFPIYVNNWFTTADRADFDSFVADFAGMTGSLSGINNYYSMEGWIVADVFCEGLRRIAESGKDFTADNYIEAMESDKIMLKMGTIIVGDIVIETRLDYMYSYRTGSLSLGLYKFSDDCTIYQEVDTLTDWTDWRT